MKTQCAVIGWVLEDAEREQVLIREQDGEVVSQRAAISSTRSRAIQTGVFRRGRRIVDPVTLETLGYEMDRDWNPILALS